VDTVVKFENFICTVIVLVGLRCLLGSLFAKQLNWVKPAIVLISVITFRLIIWAACHRYTDKTAYLFLCRYIVRSLFYSKIAVGFFFPRFFGFTMEQVGGRLFRSRSDKHRADYHPRCKNFNQLAVLASIMYIKIIIIINTTVAVPMLQKLEEQTGATRSLRLIQKEV
jgi:hypothetical protein